MPNNFFAIAEYCDKMAVDLFISKMRREFGERPYPSADTKYHPLLLEAYKAISERDRNVEREDEQLRSKMGYILSAMQEENKKGL